MYFKRKLFYRYQKSFSKITFLDIFKERPNIRSNYWLQTVILKKNKENLLKPILKKCHDNGLFVRPSWRPLHRLKFFKKYPKMNLDNTNSLSKRIINLPSSSFLIK